ncbi:MAG TPA: PHP domain-containing protein [Vicinamibacteria bacterium]|nr:PHP domain-containing protein [Vicinamibacteria bacterium]
MLADFHLHTIVSDGELDPRALLVRAKAHGVTHLSITDHDALGAYAWNGGSALAEAERLGLDLTVGIEMDADLEGFEVHVLGFDLALDDPALNAHLESVRVARAERARREIGIVNGLLGEGTISEAAIFVPGRETLMKPHFIHPILGRGHFATYEEASAWYRRNVKAGVPVPKPPFEEALRLIHGAGGWAALAHPGYYEKAGRPVAARLAEWKALGLDAVELDYPYHACSPHQFAPGEERAFIDAVRRAGEAAGLRFTRGSDSHSAGDLERVYGPPSS